MAGLGVSVRTPLGLAAGVRAIGAREAGLPSLPMLGLSLYRAHADAPPAVLRLQTILREAIEGLPLA